jgi:alkanesulfonate monooxygenase SsuD/methylene tetrahydromethanopterin reductase-like flavin-dependent oxidoreductase (luciferase family)
MGVAPPRRGLGVNAGLEAGVAARLAAACDRLGYVSLWSNDEPGAPGLETLAAFAAGAPRMELGVGVLPLDRHRPEAIAKAVARLGLDPGKLWVGVGSGSIRPQVDIVRRSVSRLRELLPRGTRIVVAAMRPRLCRLGGAVADGVLLNWMLPEHVDRARRWVLEGADEAGRPPPVVASYVRVAVGPGATERLREAEAFYRTVNEDHRRHFEAMGVPLGSVGVVGAARSDVRDALAPYQAALELPIVRVLADRNETALEAVARAAAP